MTRETSIEAYNHLKETGVLSKRRFQVYHEVFRNGPITAGEVFKYGDSHNVVKGSVCARLTELREMGLVKEVGERICRLTGKTAILWDVTSRMNPLELPRKQSKTNPDVQRAVIIERERCALLAEKWNAPMAAYAIRNQGDA